MKMKKLYRLFTTVCFTLSVCFVASAQIPTSATVVDQQGNPIGSVNIFGSYGVQTSTDIDGQFQIKLPKGESVVIQKEGYESKLISVSDLTGNIILEKSLFLASEDDEIKMGVTTKDRRDIVGAVSHINTNDRLKYDNTQWVRNYINGLTLGVKGSSNIRGLGDAIFVIDGVIGRDPNLLNMEEVEQITVLKDANSVALYGSQGRNGVIIINTQRGKVNRKEINVNIRSGISTPIALPNYLSSAAYMKLFNEARNNDGLSDFYDPLEIENYRSGTNKYLYPDVDLYSKEYVQRLVNTTSVITEFSNGSDKSQYYINLGWNRSEEWVNINEDINAGTNRFNIRGNIDFKVNDWITSSIDGIAVISTTKQSRADLLSAGTTLRPNAYAPLIPSELIDTTNNPEFVNQLQAASLFNGMLLGTTQEFQSQAPIALAIAGGYEDNVFRSTQFNNSINFNLDRITPGLSAKTYLSFDFYDSYTLSIENQFKTYQPTWEDDRIIGFENVFGSDIKDLTENVSTNGFVSRLGFYGLVNYKKTIANDHSLNTTFLGYYNSENRNNIIQRDIDSHLGFQMAYDYKKRLFVDFSSSYVHSIKLPEGNRGGFSPTLGVGYVLSEESFLKNNNFINYLKLKASGGILQSDRGINGYYLYYENYSDGSNFSWADGQSSNSRQDISQGQNPGLGYEERIDLNIGFESYLLNSLWLEFNYFKSELDKQLTRLVDQYPSYYDDFRPWDNFNTNEYTGFEVGLNYKKAVNDNLTVNFGANVLYNEAKATQRSEANEFDYLNREGRELSSIFGLVDEGFYSEADFNVDSSGNYTLNDGLPIPNFGAVQPGDIKYRDQNGDGIIDNDDRIAIGQTNSPISYGINLNIKYKNFNLFVLGTGQTGSEAMKSNNYFWVDGTDKYSEVVLNRWTPSTANTATFPRLSSGANQNNFRTSTFWMYDNSFFRISRAQLTYEFDDNLTSKLGMQDLSFNFSGTNLFEIAKNRDIRQLRIGSAPLSRTFTFGLRASF
mgnify:CR=1 FL=1